MLAKSYVCWFEIPNMVNIPNNRKTRAIGKKYAAMKVNAKSKLPSCTNPDRCGMMNAYTNMAAKYANPSTRRGKNRICGVRRPMSTKLVGNWNQDTCPGGLR